MSAPFFKRPERISVAVVGFSLACHLTALAWVSVPGLGSPLTLLTEAQVLIGASAACSLGAFLVTTTRAFLTLHLPRLTFLLIVARILGPSHTVAAVILVLPFLIETFLALPAPRSLAINALLVGTNLAFDAVRLVRDPSVRHAIEAASAYLLVGATAAFGYQLIRYREATVEQTRQIANLVAANLAFRDHAEFVETESAERERNRITRDLHDVTAYALTNIAMTMNAAKVLLAENPRELPELFETTRRQAEDALQETRRTLYLLRSFEDRSLEGLHAFVNLARQFQRATGVSVQVNYGNVPFSLGKEVDALIYRLIQQGLTNAFRHGKASSVRVNLWRAAREIRVTIADNGSGGSDLHEGIGLRGMRERLQPLGGRVETQAGPAGFELRAFIPLEVCELDA